MSREEAFFWTCGAMAAGITAALVLIGAGWVILALLRLVRRILARVLDAARCTFYT